MRARYYTRVSTIEQAQEGFSLSAQADRCESFVKSQGWELNGQYEDDGYSAKDLNRPGMQLLIEDIKKRKFDVLVVYRLDRLVRSVIDLHHLLELFDQYDVKFKSVSEVFDTTTATGRLFITIIGSLAQWERENLGERVSMGLERRFQEGKWHGGIAPFGYKSAGGGLVINQEEANLVKRIFQMYKENGILKIAKILNQEGVKKRGEQHTWSIFSISYILTNPIYAGFVRSGIKDDEVLVEGEHEPIISKEEFQEAQSLLKSRSTPTGKNLTSDYPFSSVLFCPKCGSPMTGRKNKSKKRSNELTFSYNCTKKKNSRACDMKYISEESLERALLSRMQTIVEDFTIPQEEEQTPQRTKNDILKELEVVRKRKKKWQLAFAEDIISLADLKERTAEDKMLEEKLLKELTSTNEEAEVESNLNKEEFIDLINSFNLLWPYATRKEKKQLVQRLFKKIVPDHYSSKREWGKPREVKIVELELNI